VSKPNATDMTMERFFPCVRTHVGTHVARLSKGTVTHRTMQWLFCTVHVARVTHQLVSRLKPFWTSIAGVWPILTMHRSNVRSEAADEFKLATALVTAVCRFIDAVYTGDMQAQNRCELKTKTAMTADIGSGIRMNAFMVVTG